MTPGHRRALARHRSLVVLAAQDYLAAVDNASIPDLGDASVALDEALDDYFAYRQTTRQEFLGGSGGNR